MNFDFSFSPPVAPPRSLRQEYHDWVEEQIENYKDSVSRSDLLRLADEVVQELRTSESGQYQITEMLLCEAIDHRLFRLLKLPRYSAWRVKRLRYGFTASRAPLGDSIEEESTEAADVSLRHMAS